MVMPVNNSSINASCFDVRIASSDFFACIIHHTSLLKPCKTVCVFASPPPSTGHPPGPRLYRKSHPLRESLLASAVLFQQLSNPRPLCLQLLRIGTESPGD